MPNIQVVREEHDRFGRVQRTRLTYSIEVDPNRGVCRTRLLPGTTLSHLRRLSHVVAIGGGTGLPVVLAGLRRHLPHDCLITAVVTAADNGGSSGVLRGQYGVVPPGDIRNCLMALARVAPEVGAALQYRLDAPSGANHPVGNLLLMALGKVTGDDLTAIRLAASLLGVDDVVLPSTTAQVHLVAELADGRCVRGESEITQSGGPILRIYVDPPDARPSPGVLEALRTADMVILGPGSLYTSILATLIIPGVTEAVATAPGARVFVCNLMTEPGETDGFGVAAHVDALTTHGLALRALDYVLVNTAPIPPNIRSQYATAGAVPVQSDFLPRGASPFLVHADLLDSGPVIWHAPDKLGPILAELGAGHPPPEEREP